MNNAELTTEEQLREAERQRYRAECWVRCLESSLDRIGVDEFPQVMQQLEAAQEAVRAAAYHVMELRVKLPLGVGGG